MGWGYYRVTLLGILIASSLRSPADRRRPLFADSSLAARLIAIVSVGVILLSILTFCLETLPGLKQPRATPARSHTHNSSTPSEFYLNASVTQQDQPPVDFADPFFVIETLCIVWFSAEFLIRLAAAPNHLLFFSDVMNIIDLLAILPYFITLGTELADDGTDRFRATIYVPLCRCSVSVRDGTGSHFVTQRPSDPGIQRPGDPVDPVTLFYNELQMSTYVRRSILRPKNF